MRTLIFVNNCTLLLVRPSLNRFAFYRKLEVKISKKIKNLTHLSQFQIQTLRPWPLFFSIFLSRGTLKQLFWTLVASLDK